MPLNKLALIRYKTIDECLQNRFRKWTLEDLIEKVSDVLYDYEGIKAVSKRTIQADIQLMRSDKLGYNAPIIVKDKKYYTYEDPKFSITKVPLQNVDVEKVKEVVSLLRQFEGFSYFDELGEMITRLESKLYQTSHDGRSVIQFETNKLLRGLEYVYPLYQAIVKKRPLLIAYKSFKARDAQLQIYHPYLLKEYRNRWFLVAKPKKGKVLLNLALDRIESFQNLPDEPFVEFEEVQIDSFFDDVIGVSKTLNDKPQKIVLEVNTYNVPYLLTKPLHPSQTLLRQDDNGIIISIQVIINFELEREILGFGEGMKVLSPRMLQSRIRKRLASSLEKYEVVKEKRSDEV